MIFLRRGSRVCFFCIASKKLGIFFKRDDYINPKIKDLRNVLEIQLFEIELFDEAFKKFIVHQYKSFDALVGDRKCQVRASMLLDIIQNNIDHKAELEDVKADLNRLKEGILDLIEKTEMHHIVETKKVIEEMKNLSLYEFFEKNHLNYKIMHDFFYIGICFFANPFMKNKNLDTYDGLSDKKYIKLLNGTKHKLSLISIEYEQDLAKTYGTIEIQKVLGFIQTKGFCSMTAFYPSFIPIWEKMKDKKQLVLKKTIYFCECAGVQDVQSDLFKANSENKFEKISKSDLTEAAFVIEGYSYKGSLEKLKNHLNVPVEHTEIKQEYLKLCECKKNFTIPEYKSFDDIIFASFVQHAQFTTDAEIPWTELGLENSDLKKEYDRLMNLPGCSLDDMSIFRINHIYVSTVEQ